MSHYIVFSKEEEKILVKNRLVIQNNERNYVFTGNDDFIILDTGTPTFFSCQDFSSSSRSWSHLLTSFTDWFLEKTNLSTDELLKINFDSNDKPIFFEKQQTNCYGPLKNGLYVNGNPTSANLVWKKILFLAGLISEDTRKSCIVYIHYPGRIEPKEITDLIWIKEMTAFSKHLTLMGYNYASVKKQLENVKILNSKYRQIRPNYIFFTIDRPTDFSNALSILRRQIPKDFIPEFIPLLNNIAGFRKEVVYEDKNYFLLNHY